MIHRDAIEALIKEAITFTLDAHGLYAGGAVEDMADAATAAVMGRLGEEPGLEAIECDALAGPLLIVPQVWQARPQATPCDCVRRPEDSHSAPASIYRFTSEEMDWSRPAPPTVPHPDFKPGELIKRKTDPGLPGSAA